MALTLPARLEALVKQKVAEGPYDSEIEVLEEALRLLDEQDRMRQMRLAYLRKGAIQDVGRGIVLACYVPTANSRRGDRRARST